MGKSCWHYPPGDTACFAVIIFYTILYSATGIILTPCGSDNTAEILDIRGDTTVTCSGIPDDFIVDWSLFLPSRPTAVDVGSCNVGSTTCSDFSVIGYLATRPFSNTSVMSINPTQNANFVRNGTLECKASKAGNPNQVGSCRLDITSPPSSVRCTVQPDTKASSVIGRCNVTKVYSYNGRYSCQWYSTEKSAAETEVTVPVDMQATPTADVTPTGGQYVNVMFNVTMTRKLTVDTSYKVVIRPGSVTEGAGKMGAIIIFIPGFAVGIIVGIVIGCCCGIIVLTCVGYASYVCVCWIISKKYRCECQGGGPPPPGGHLTPVGQTPQGGHSPPEAHPPPVREPQPAGHPSPSKPSPSGGHPPPGGPPPQWRYPPPGWHVHYLCGKRIDYVYFSQCCLRNRCIVLILSRSPKTKRFRFFGTEDGPSGRVSPMSTQNDDSNTNAKTSKADNKAEYKGSDGSKVQ